MNYPIKLTENAEINQIEWLNGDIEDLIIHSYSIYFTFYGKEYSADITQKELDENDMSFNLEGDSELFHSALNLLEDNLDAFKIIKKSCSEYYESFKQAYQ